MITKDTLVYVWMPDCPYSSGPSQIRKPTQQEVENCWGYGQNTWICSSSFGCIIIQKDMPYRDVFFWHEKGHSLYQERHRYTSKFSQKVEQFCDDFMLLMCGWKRTMTAQLWSLSQEADDAFLFRKRVLAQVGSHEEEFIKMVDDRINMLEKRLASNKRETGMKFKVDTYWLKELKKTKEEFEKQKNCCQS